MCLLHIGEYIEGKEQFYHSRLVQDAVIRNLQVIAESSQRLDESIKKTYPEMPWKEIPGFRKVLVHDYLGVDLAVILTEYILLRRSKERIPVVQEHQPQGCGCLSLQRCIYSVS